MYSWYVWYVLYMTTRLNLSERDVDILIDALRYSSENGAFDAPQDDRDAERLWQRLTTARTRVAEVDR